MKEMLFHSTIRFGLGQSSCERSKAKHTTYSRNSMAKKCEGNCGLWVLNEIIENMYPENLKKIVGAVWELPAK